VQSENNSVGLKKTSLSPPTSSFPTSSRTPPAPSDHIAGPPPVHRRQCPPLAAGLPPTCCRPCPPRATGLPPLLSPPPARVASLSPREPPAIEVTRPPEHRQPWLPHAAGQPEVVSPAASSSSSPHRQPPPHPHPRSHTTGSLPVPCLSLHRLLELILSCPCIFICSFVLHIAS
jgi:hypothetical protein